MSQNYGVGKSVLIPAGEFARYSEIEIPVSLLPANGPPEDCGMAASSSEHCDVTDSWSGIITLHREPGN